jgi:hypothetical protein
MTSGVEITEVDVNAGNIAEKSARVVVHVRGTLNRGEVFMDTFQDKRPMHIKLSKRDCIGGLRYGIVGMRVGGHRHIVVSPHLGYGAEGLPDKIPPNAVLRFDVELLEVRKSRESKPEDFPCGKNLYFFWPGEASRNKARIQFGLEEDGRCGIGMTIPRPGLTWRYAKTEHIEDNLDISEAGKIFEEILALPKKHPEACLNDDVLWSDASEKGNGVTRESRTNTACVTIGVQERRGWLCHYSLCENDPVFLQLKLYNLVKNLVAKSLSAK